jgi:hypothetical protein
MFRDHLKNVSNVYDATDGFALNRMGGHRKPL